MERSILIVLLSSVPIVVSFSFVVFLQYRQKRESYFREVQLKNQLEKSDLEMKALRAQVNPHFIFNCLISIQHFIHRNEPQDAEHYLVKFSRLIRLVLENSTYSTVPLSDDLQALELYLEMEKLRLNHSFDYNIKLEHLDASEINIPPLLIQPFVENSIWHGLSNKGKEGKLQINLRLDDDKLKCNVNDNGKRMEKSMNSSIKSKSMGLDLIRQRLEMLSKLYDSEFTFSISDNRNKEGKSIELTIPYQ